MNRNQKAMLEPLINAMDFTVTALEALAVVNGFLSEHLPDRFTADQAERVDSHWCVPVVLSHPRIGSIGRVGVVTVDAKTAAIVNHIPFDQIKMIGMALYNENQDAIAAAF